jgi:hypothetical protein
MRGQIKIPRNALGFEIEQNLVSLFIGIIPTVKNVTVPPGLERLFLISFFDGLSFVFAVKAVIVRYQIFVLRPADRRYGNEDHSHDANSDQQSDSFLFCHNITLL